MRDSTRRLIASMLLNGASSKMKPMHLVETIAHRTGCTEEEVMSVVHELGCQLRADLRRMETS